MSNYPYTHEKGSLVYKKENYIFRFRGIHAAEIEIIDVPGENAAFAFHIEENKSFWSEVPSYLLKKLHSGSDELKPFGVELTFYNDKDAAIQVATDTIEKILNKYKNPGKLDF
ncbi:MULTISPECIES: hypothetical protein [Bacillus]|nr:MULTISPECIES: hypothetical protein [Bacillus]MCY8213189.1 hypothetical protein [Bacillus spizizenii]UXZ16086.1 hypothetical protein KI431_09405 [Bacillus siamensis]AHZ15877.1 hypothetical protein V529_18510 [Bacillus velezensis SQR9]MCC2532702.1 hypothetical protein [Bacillus velezensis]MDH2299920.1 hypothetical protein [Bacillus velezensis]